MLSAGIVIGSALLIVVQGEDAVPAATWSKAQAVTNHILNRAGLGALWGSQSSLPPAFSRRQSAVSVHLTRSRPGTLHADTAGYAVLSPHSRYASVFLPGVERTAAELEVDPGTALGATIAHEVGHLLLGTAHSGGVMSPRFDWRQMRAAERGELLFRDDDARRLQRTLAALIK